VLDLAAELKLDSSFEILDVRFETFRNDNACSRLKRAQVHRGGNWGRAESRGSNPAPYNGPFPAKAVIEEEGWLVFTSLQPVDDGKGCRSIALKQGYSGSYAVEACNS